MDQLKTLVEQLARSSEALVTETHSLRSELTVAQDRVKRTQNWLIFAVIGLAVVVAALMVLGYIANRNAENIGKLADAGKRVQCNFYTLVLDANNPDLNRDGEVTPEERTAFERYADTDGDGVVTDRERKVLYDQLEQVRQQYDDLNCSEVALTAETKEEGWQAARMATL